MRVTTMSDQAAYDEAKRRQKACEGYLASNPVIRVSYEAWAMDALMDFGVDAYDWPGWADMDGFLDPRDGWSR